MKKNICKYCGGHNHSSLECFNRPHKRIKPISDKTLAKKQETDRAWYEANPPDEYGRWRCYISKHPLCPVWLTAETLVLEHDQSKARRKDLQFDITNIYPACSYDNEAKGSLSAKEYMAL